VKLDEKFSNFIMTANFGIHLKKNGAQSFRQNFAAKFDKTRTCGARQGKFKNSSKFYHLLHGHSPKHEDCSRGKKNFIHKNILHNIRKHSFIHKNIDPHDCKAKFPVFNILRFVDSLHLKISLS
jgi:hypothetical protein